MCFLPQLMLLVMINLVAAKPRGGFVVNQIVGGYGGQGQGQGQDGGGDGDGGRRPPPPPIVVTCNETSPVNWNDIGMNGSDARCSGDDRRSYYNTFVEGDQRVVVTSGIPDHPYGPPKNGNTHFACENWVYMKVPANPTKGTSFQKSGMGPVGFAVSGAFIFNHLATPRGVDDVAPIVEADTFDACGGHTDPLNLYHYHKAPNCIPGYDKCGLMGYHYDGFGVYGTNCNGTDGHPLKSCYTLIDAANPDDSGSYEFNSTKEGCNLDQSNGYDFGGGKGYAYVFTLDYPFSIPGYYGTEKAANICKITE